MNYFEIGQRIRRYRKANNLSQEELSEIIGISVTHMSHIETGNTKLSLPVFVAIANALNIQTDELLSDVQHSRTSALDDLAEVLDSCNPQEIKILTDVIKSVKISLDKYLPTLH